MFEHLIEELGRNDRLSENTIVSGISYLLFQLKRLAADSEHNKRIKPKTAWRFSKLVSDTISENLTVKDYADRLHISVEKLNELCKESYGQNPKKMILEQKITEAKRLLYFTELSVKEIAFKLGFEDSSYFSRVFKQKTKVSPSHLKRT